MTINKVLLAILIFFVAAGFLVAATIYGVNNSITKTIDSLFKPVEQANHQVQTQIALVLHPTPTVVVDPVTIIYDVQSLARLETIQYSLEKIITAQIGQNQFKAFFGDKLLFVAHGTVIAGIDLRKISEKDIWVVGDVLHIKLPPAEVFVHTLNNQKSYVYDRETGLFTRGDVTLETTARKAAENEILKAALEDGILKHAEANGVVFMERFLDELGYEKVIFED